MENEEHYYKKLAELTSEIEGEIIQDIYFFFKEYELDRDMCEEVPIGYKGSGLLIPSLEDIHDMREGLKKMFEDRHNIFIKNNLYNI